MRFEKPALATMHTESDVEQKFVYPLLISEQPGALGIDGADIQTKANLKSFTIGKGASKKVYFPDYVITKNGLPLVIVEAKAPGENLVEAFREARLYAVALNSAYPAGLNPASKIIATDGNRVLAGVFDQGTPVHDLAHGDVDPATEKMSRFIGEFGAKALAAEYERLQPRFRPQRLWKPRKMIGGAAIQREEVGLNSFGATISADFSHIFNPINHEDRVAIARHGYISSKRRERYIEPIDRIIRAATPASISRSKTLDDTSKPKEIIAKFRAGRKLERQVLLLVGSAGAGKTTFVDYLQEVALPADIKSKTVWVRLNLNPAPISRTEIYDWLRREIIEGLHLAHPKIDFEDLETLKAVHAPDVNAFRKGVGRLLEKDKDAWNAKLADILNDLAKDLHKLALSTARYLSTQAGKLLVIVLDNCDKRLRDEQLLMFEAAQWLQREFAGLIVLPLREETYDNHRDEPPLDTALKDLVFRIEPPLFQHILQSRVQMALNSISEQGSKMLRYDLPNGMHVDYPASEQAYYLSSIMRSIFEHGLHVRRLIVGLSGRNMRRALEIFLEFCTSGHIGSDEFLKIRHSQGTYVLPLHLVTTVLLRINQRFYSSSRAYLKNAFEVDEHDARINYFTRLMILRILVKRMDIFGPKHLKGYEHVGSIRKVLADFGVEQPVFERELEQLARGFCIVTENFSVENIKDDDLIALSPAGLVHNQMMGDVHYLAAIAEDTWFFAKGIAENIATRIKDEATHYTAATAIYNTYDLLEVMNAARERERAAISAYRDEAMFEELTDLRTSWHGLSKFERTIIAPPWPGARVRYPVGSCHKGFVKAVKDFGIFIEMEHGLDALMPASKLHADLSNSSDFDIGKAVLVEIFSIDHYNHKMIVIPSV
jgi:hypothetical protein